MDLKKTLHTIGVFAAAIAALAPVISEEIARVYAEHPKAGGLVILVALLSRLDKLRMPPAPPAAPAVALLLALSLVSAGCPGGCQAGPGRIIQCAADSARRNPELVRAVEECLATGDYVACLSRLAGPGFAWGYELVACIVADRAEVVAAQGDDLRAGRARDWLERERVEVKR